MQHPEQRGAVGGELVITWEPACRADRQGGGQFHVLTETASKTW